jgi:hypothetical protein
MLWTQGREALLRRWSVKRAMRQQERHWRGRLCGAGAAGGEVEVEAELQLQLQGQEPKAGQLAGVAR